MLGYLLTAAVAFCCGFLVAGVFAAGRRHDDVRAGDLLADAVADFADEHGDRAYDVGNRVAVARGRLERLEQALDLHHELRSS